MSSSKSGDFDMQITGPEGREWFVLREHGRVVGSGDLRKAVAKSNSRRDRVKTSARERVTRFARKNTALVSAEARLRKFQVDSRLTGM